MTEKLYNFLKDVQILKVGVMKKKIKVEVMIFTRFHLDLNSILSSLSARDAYDSRCL